MCACIWLVLSVKFVLKLDRRCQSQMQMPTCRKESDQLQGEYGFWFFCELKNQVVQLIFVWIRLAWHPEWLRQPDPTRETFECCYILCADVIWMSSINAEFAWIMLGFLFFCVACNLYFFCLLSYVLNAKPAPTNVWHLIIGSRHPPCKLQQVFDLQRFQCWGICLAEFRNFWIRSDVHLGWIWNSQFQSNSFDHQAFAFKFHGFLLKIREFFMARYGILKFQKCMVLRKNEMYLKKGTFGKTLKCTFFLGTLEPPGKL